MYYIIGTRTFCCSGGGGGYFKAAFCTAPCTPRRPVDDGEGGVVDAKQHGQVAVVHPAEREEGCLIINFILLW